MTTQLATCWPLFYISSPCFIRIRTIIQYRQINPLYNIIIPFPLNRSFPITLTLSKTEAHRFLTFIIFSHTVSIPHPFILCQAINMKFLKFTELKSCYRPSGVSSAPPVNTNSHATGVSSNSMRNSTVMKGSRSDQSSGQWRPSLSAISEDVVASFSATKNETQLIAHKNSSGKVESSSIKSRCFSRTSNVKERESNSWYVTFLILLYIVPLFVTYFSFCSERDHW